MRRKRKQPEHFREEIYLGGYRSGGILAEEFWQADGVVTKYSLAYIDLRLCQHDNGRVLGYDNAHGVHERHWMGKASPFEYQDYFKTRDQFQSEVEDLWRKHYGEDS